MSDNVQHLLSFEAAPQHRNQQQTLALLRTLERMYEELASKLEGLMLKTPSSSSEEKEFNQSLATITPTLRRLQGHLRRVREALAHDD